MLLRAWRQLSGITRAVLAADLLKSTQIKDSRASLRSKPDEENPLQAAPFCFWDIHGEQMGIPDSSGRKDAENRLQPAFGARLDRLRSTGISTERCGIYAGFQAPLEGRW